MQALKFETDVINNIIQIPKRFQKNVAEHHIEVIMMYQQNINIKESNNKMKNVFSDKFKANKIKLFSRESFNFLINTI